jgi:hypothetical protein
MGKIKKERVSVGLPEVVDAFGVLYKSLIATLVTEKLLTVDKAQGIFDLASDALLRSDAKGAAAVAELMQNQMNWDELSDLKPVGRRGGPA